MVSLMNLFEPFPVLMRRPLDDVWDDVDMWLPSRHRRRRHFYPFSEALTLLPVADSHSEDDEANDGDVMVHDEAAESEARRSSIKLIADEVSRIASDPEVQSRRSDALAQLEKAQADARAKQLVQLATSDPVELVVRMEGIPRDCMRIEVHKGRLVVSGRYVETSSRGRIERQIHRSWTLPSGVKASDISARSEKGQLLIRILPKRRVSEVGKLPEAKRPELEIPLSESRKE